MSAVRLKTTTAAFAAALCLTFVQTASASAPATCEGLFAESPQPAREMLGVSLYYAPPMVTAGGVIGIAQQVLVETYSVGFKPRRQKLMTYQNPVTGIAHPFGRLQFHDAGLKAIYANYGPLVDPKIVKIVMRVESALPLNRQTSMIVRATGPKGADGYGDVLGFMRVFDGSVFSRTSASGGREQTNTRLPLEKILAATGRSTSVIDTKRREGFRVFEIGKYFLDGEMSPVELLIARRELLSWLDQYITERGPSDLKSSYYFAHVASRVHQNAYRRFFGFKEAPRELSQGLAADENILMIRGDELKASLTKILAEPTR